MRATLFSSVQAPICSICNLPVALNNAKTDEDGNAIHEDCYLSKLGVEPITTHRKVSAGSLLKTRQGNGEWEN
jgi:hypothetical protein